MNNIIISTDWHLTEKNKDELFSVLNEIYFNNPKIKECSSTWIIGDLFDRKRPSPLEYKYMTEILTKLSKILEVNIVTGNHEELTSQISALDYSEYLNINLHRFNAKLKLDKKIVYFGHHPTDQTDIFFKDERYKVSDLESKYDLAVLGDYHNFKQLGSHTYHLGSPYYINWKEVDHEAKKYAILCPNSCTIDFYDINLAIPMYDVHSIKEALKMPSEAKIRIIFDSLEDYLASLEKLPELKNKFHTFTVKLAFKEEKKENEIEKIIAKKKNFDEIFTDYLQTIKNKEVKKLIKEVHSEIAKN